MKKTYSGEATGEDSFEEVQEWLQGLDLDASEVTGISIEIECDPDKPSMDEDQKELTDEWRPQVVDRDNVSYGPTPESERGTKHTKRGENNGGAAYYGSKSEGAVMPDTAGAEVLEAIDGRWMTAQEVADETGVKYNTVSSHISTFFHKKGYVKRKDDEYPYKHKLDQDGRSALELGRKVFAQRQSEQEAKEIEIQ